MLPPMPSLMDSRCNSIHSAKLPRPVTARHKQAKHANRTQVLDQIDGNSAPCFDFRRACRDVGRKRLDIREKTFCCACHELTLLEVRSAVFISAGTAAANALGAVLRTRKDGSSLRFILRRAPGGR